MSKVVPTRTRLTSGFANILAFITAILEGVMAIILLLLSTIILGVEFLIPEAWDTLVLSFAIVTIISFGTLGILLYTPLSELIHYSIKLLLSSFLSLLIIIGILIITTHPNYLTYHIYGVLATIVFLIESVILYFLNYIRGKRMALMVRHKQALDQLTRLTSAISDKLNKDVSKQIVKASTQAYSTWGLIFKGEILERWDLAKVFNKSIVFALFFVGVSYLYSTSTQISPGTMSIIFGLATFLVILGLIALDLIKSEKTRKSL